MSGLVGARVTRINDSRLLTGRGTYVDDISLPGMLHAVVVRSAIAHGRVTQFDATEALAQEDVLAVVTPAQAMASLGTLPLMWLAPEQRHTEVPVASTEVRYVGQPIGVVVAESRASAEDAQDVLEIGYDEHDGVVDAEDALSDGAPLLYPEWGTNVVAAYDIGDGHDEIERVIASAAHVVERRMRIQRVAVSPIEPRGLVAHWDPGLETLTVWMSTQVSHHARDHLARVLGLRADQVRVIARDVGGGFGGKEHLYADEALACLAAMVTGRPVKWIEDRGEHFTATFHARDAVHRARLALDADGRFLAIHSDIVGNCGAHASNVGTGPFRISSLMLPGPYRFERAGTTITAVVTSTTPTGSLRGFGMQEASWVRERLVDEAARELGIDPVELRMRNMLGPDDLPYQTRTYQLYDSGDYPEALRRVSAEIGKRARPSAGRIRRGIGLSTHVEFTGLGPSKAQQIVGFHLGGFETGIVRVEPDGSVLVTSGVVGMGQGIETALAQLAAEQLGVPMSAVRVQLGDTATAPYSACGSIASRSAAVGGGAVVRAATRLRERLVGIAAHRLEAEPADIEVANGVFRVKGAPDERSLTLHELAERAWLGWDLPKGERADLEEKDVLDPENVSYSYATHAAGVAVDLDTGRVRIEDYWLVHDAGTVVNPMIADGQVIGGVAHGIGIALHEEMLYDPSGQPITTSYLDYVMPMAEDVPDMDVRHMGTPAPHIPGGMKGLGEGGTILSPVTIGNAVAAAVPEIAERLNETPLSPSRLWQLMHQAGLHEDRESQELFNASRQRLRLAARPRHEGALRLRDTPGRDSDLPGAIDFTDAGWPRSVLVTGSASGIGAAVTRAFAARGAHVIGVDLVTSPDAHASITGDVRDPDVHQRAVRAAVEVTGRLDALIANAGVHDGELGLHSDVRELSARTRQVLEVDVLGYVLALHAAAPELTKARGCVVMTLSDAAFFVGDNHAGIAYTAAKHALVGVLRWAARQLAPEVRVNGVAPGGVPTGLRSAAGEHVFADADVAVAGVAALNPLGSVLSPDEIAQSYLFLASPSARGMTGEILRADGGLSVR